MLGWQQAINVWLTLWISFQHSYDDLTSQGSVKSPGYAPLPSADVHYWINQMDELIVQSSDHDVEFYIPQLLAILLSQDLPTRSNEVSEAVIARLGTFLLKKALNNNMIALHLVWQLRAATISGTCGMGRNSIYASSGEKSIAHEWLKRIENAAAVGWRLPRHLGDINRCLLRRIETRGCAFENPVGGEWPWDDIDIIVSRPDLLNFAIILPLRSLKNEWNEKSTALRVLRIVKEFSHPLRSKEKVPYLVTAEVLKTTIRCESHRIYLQGDRIGMCAKDVIEQREVPHSLMQELQSLDIDAEFIDDGHHNPDEDDDEFFSKAFSQYHNWDNIHMEKSKKILHSVFTNSDETKTRMVQMTSPFGKLKGWGLSTFIVKAGDEVRQETLAMQVLTLIRKIWKREGLDLWLRPYSISCVGYKAALVECLTDAKSIDEIKKKTPEYTSMQDYFERLYMSTDSELFERAQNNFVRSLAGYCIVTYLLQVKDRHNGNIMLDVKGHIIHIDFGFMLGTSPGLWTHETTPFKLTQDYIDIVGGLSSPKWALFQDLFLKGFRAIQKNISDIVSIIQVMMPPNDRKSLLEILKLKKRILSLQSDEDILALIRSSSNSLKTWQYDYIQYLQNGIAM